MATLPDIFLNADFKRFETAAYLTAELRQSTMRFNLFNPVCNAIIPLIYQWEQLSICSTVKKKIFFLALLLLTSIWSGNLIAQNNNQSSDDIETLWSKIETRLDQQTSDTSFDFILQLVRRQCGTDYNCLYPRYYALMIKLEARFNLPGAIYVGNEIVKIAQKKQALNVEGQAYIDLFRYYDALDQTRSAASSIEKALHLFEQTGNRSKLALCKHWKLSSSLKYFKIEDVLPAIEALLDEAIVQNDTESIIRLRKDLVHQTLEARQFGKTAKHLDALEAVAKPKPLTKHEKYLWVQIWRGRGAICKEIRDFEAAKRFYTDALRLSKEASDKWLEISCLQSLAELDWELGNRLSAKSYLEQAYTFSQALKLEDLLISCFEIKARFAEAEGRYAEALEFTKKVHLHREKLMNRGAGLNAQNYFLELEKEKLEIKMQYEANLKASRLRSFIIILVLAALLATGLIIALYVQRKGKRALAAQNALIQLQANQLKNLDAAKSRFFASVSHELRTPLTLLLGPVHSLLKEHNLTEKQTRLLHIARRSGAQLEQLVNEILDLQKLEMGQMRLNETPTVLPSFFRNYFAQFESLAERKQIDFSLELSMTPDLTAWIDQEKYRQIVNNLLSNAFKFTPIGGQISAKIAVRDGLFELSVADTGPGIHPDDLPHLFDRFFQTTRPDKPAEGGTGIGLNLCQEYARLFGGDISVESTLGKGSIFSVAFPVKLDKNAMHLSSPDQNLVETNTLEYIHETDLAPATDSAHQPAQNSPSNQPENLAQQNPSGASKPTILVVEDNPDLQDYIRLVLSENYHVATAEHGQAALDYLARRTNPTTPDPSPTGRGAATPSTSPLPVGEGSGVGLVLSDLMMPVMDGYQLLEKLKSDDSTRHIPVIMLTARAEARDRLKALRIGVDDYLLKPFDEEELLVRIENLLKNQANRRPEAAAEALGELESVGPAMSETDREWLEAFEVFVQKNLSDNILAVSTLAFEFAMSESTLLRQLKRLTGLTPAQYLQELRLDKARELLENRRYNSIAEVAAKVGYNDARSFSRVFRARFGKLPSELLGG